MTMVTICPQEDMILQSNLGTSIVNYSVEVNIVCVYIILYHDTMKKSKLPFICTIYEHMAITKKFVLKQN